MESRAGIYVFEGIDNVGKTTIIQALKKRIDKVAKIDCINISFPGHEPRTLGNLVYQIHHNQEQYFNIPINEASLQLLHVASHIDLIQRKLGPLSNSECIVLLDRFWWSTYVYGLAGELEEDMIRAIIAPELLFWKNINIQKIFLLERNERKRDYDVKKENMIIEKYRKFAEQESKCILIDNNASIENAVDRIYSSINGE